MIDKCDVAIPANRVRQEFWNNELIPQMKVQRVSSDGLYRARVGLRPVNIPALMHLTNRYSRSRSHKVEFFDVELMTVQEMEIYLAHIVEGDPRTLRLMRVDLAVDVPDIPVGVFREYVSVRKKQVTVEFEKVRQQRRRGETETLVFGRPPNCIRIYDKVAERNHQYAKLKRRGVTTPFEAIYGHAMGGVVITRVERQYSGSQIPDQIRTFGQLSNAVHVQPFAPLRFVAFDVANPDGLTAVPVAPLDEDGSLREIAIRTFIRNLHADVGAVVARAFINSHTGGNAARYLKKYCGGCGRNPERPIFPDLQRMFVQSVAKQLGDLPPDYQSGACDLRQ